MAGINTYVYVEEFDPGDDPFDEPTPYDEEDYEYEPNEEDLYSWLRSKGEV